MIVVAYFSFMIPHFDLDFTDKNSGWGTVSKCSIIPVSISWTMKSAKNTSASVTGCFVRSMYFRSTITPRYLAIPENGAAFFTVFLSEIHAMWLALAAKSSLYIAHNVSDSLQKLVVFVPLLIARLGEP